jgi:hypothetical protein
MDTTTKSTLALLIQHLRADLSYTQSELSRLDYVEEVASPPADTRNCNVANDSRHGMVNLPIHYTLGRGVLEALGDKVEKAVFSAFRTVSRGDDVWGTNQYELDYLGIGMSIDLYWDRDNQCVCLHLDLVKTDSSIENDRFGEEIAVPPGRTLS